MIYVFSMQNVENDGVINANQITERCSSLHKSGPEDRESRAFDAREEGRRGRWLNLQFIYNYIQT